MIKGIVFFILGVIIGVGSYIVYSELQQKPIIRTELSGRAREYLTEQKQANNLNFANVGEENDAKGEINKRVQIDDCFSLVIPYRLKFERKDGECDFTYGFLLPRGNLVAYLRNEASTDWGSVPGVSMRRQSSHTYEEKIIQAGGKEFLTFRNKSVGGYEVNAFYRQPSYFIVVNLSVMTSEDPDPKLRQILESVVIN